MSSAFYIFAKKLPRNLSGEVFERLAGFRRPQAAKLNEIHFRDGPEHASRGASVSQGARSRGADPIAEKGFAPFGGYSADII